MKKLYGIISCKKEVPDEQQFTVFTGTHGKHGTKTNNGVSTKNVKVSRLVVDQDYLTKSAFVKELSKKAKEMDGTIELVSYFNN